MKITERIALLRAGYTRAEIDAMIAEEAAEPETLAEPETPETPAEPETSKTPAEPTNTEVLEAIKALTHALENSAIENTGHGTGEAVNTLVDFGNAVFGNKSK